MKLVVPSSSGRNQHDIAERELAREVVVVDILEGVPQGKALDARASRDVRVLVVERRGRCAGDEE